MVSRKITFILLFCSVVLPVCRNFLFFTAVWGPFLIISPASTLHNWQQEIAKFVPSLKVVPYWGNPNVSASTYLFIQPVS